MNVCSEQVGRHRPGPTLRFNALLSPPELRCAALAALFPGHSGQNGVS